MKIEKSPSLNDLRQEIDAIDTRLIALIKERMTIVEQVGQLKAKQNPGTCPLRPGREATQLRSIVETFSTHHFHPQAAATIWRMLIMGALHIESDLTIAVAPEPKNTLWWQAREYFGTFVPMQQHTSYRQCIVDVIEKNADIAILPGLAAETESIWWKDLIYMENAPTIFATIPFIASKGANTNNSAIAVGYIPCEPTGDDSSILIMETKGEVSMQKLQAAFHQQSLAAEWITICTVDETTRHHVVKVNAFLTRHDEKLITLRQATRESVSHIFYLGAYANPIILNT